MSVGCSKAEPKI